MRFLFLLLAMVFTGGSVQAQWTKAIEQIPQLKSLTDATDELQSAIDAGSGNLDLRGKMYRITRPLVIDLKRHGAVSIRGSAGTTLVMDGGGAALKFVGTHAGTASPRSFEPATWNERMPIVSGIEIVGAHAEADGIELQYSVGAIVNRVSVRWCRHGIRLAERNRNVVISDCHLYENSGIGIFLDDVNLHQINVSNSHVSYNRGGGIVVRDGNVRNLQVTGCDIEANMPGDETPTETANVLVDLRGSENDKTKSVAEIAITGCTIQHAANYSGAEDKSIAPGGANIRLAGKEIYPINSVTITGNVISDTTTNVDIQYAHDVAINSNTFFAPKPNNIVVANSQRVVISGNTFNPRQFIRPGTIRFTDCADCILANSTIHKFSTDHGAVVLERCNGFLLTGLSLTDCGSGIVLKESSQTTIANCRISRTTEGGLDLDVDRASRDVTLKSNSFAGDSRVELAPTE